MLKRLTFLLTILISVTVQAKEDPKPVYVEAANQTPAAPPADQAQIILIEPINKIQGLFPVGIFELDGDNRKLIGATGWRSKQVLLLAPGKHMLMSNQGGGAGHVMEANVEAGKRYYVLLRFIYANGMQLRPLRPSGTSEYRVDGPDFPKWQKATHFVEMTPDAAAYFDKLKESIDKAQQVGMDNWQARTAAEAAELTLNVEDAVAF